LKSAKEARQSGFDLADRTNADLQRSEVYISSISKRSGKYVDDFMTAFLLGSKGRLVSVTSEPVPTVADVPQTVQVFGGSADYGGVKAPIYLRLAIDRTGTLVNSWIEVSLEKRLATPLTGRALFCETEPTDVCTVTGDGKGFSQSWVIEPDPEGKGKFDSNLPFSGLRNFQLTLTKDGIKARISEPNVRINGQEEMSFELARNTRLLF
jgi:hypothetical protein